jgi:hypothetical protein
MDRCKLCLCLLCLTGCSSGSATPAPAATSEFSASGGAPPAMGQAMTSPLSGGAPPAARFADWLELQDRSPELDVGAVGDQEGDDACSVR